MNWASDATTLKRRPNPKLFQHSVIFSARAEISAGNNVVFLQFHRRKCIKRRKIKQYKNFKYDNEIERSAQQSMPTKTTLLRCVINCTVSYLVVTNKTELVMLDFTFLR